MLIPFLGKEFTDGPQYGVSHGWTEASNVKAAEFFPVIISICRLEYRVRADAGEADDGGRNAQANAVTLIAHRFRSAQQNLPPLPRRPDQPVVAFVCALSNPRPEAGPR